MAQDFGWRTVAKKFAVPAENADRRDTYAKKLEAAGFAEVRVDSIRNHVFPGWHHSLAQDSDLFRRIHPVGRLPYRLLLRLDANTVYSALDYVLASCACRKLTLVYIDGAVRPKLARPTCDRRSGRRGGSVHPASLISPFRTAARFRPSADGRALPFVARQNPPGRGSPRTFRSAHSSHGDSEHGVSVPRLRGQGT